MGTLLLLDGRQGNVVLVSSRRNAKGAVMVLPAAAKGEIQTVAVVAGLNLLHPNSVVDILCMQERAFGKSGLPAPSEADA